MFRVVFVMLVILGCSTANSDATIAKKMNTSNKIQKLVDTSVTLLEDDSRYSLPKTVKAVWKDGTVKQVPVVWENNHIVTSRVGTTIYWGTVANYAIKAKLTLKVVPNRVELSIGKAKALTSDFVLSASKDAVESDNIFFPTDDLYLSFGIWNTGTKRLSGQPICKVTVDGYMVVQYLEPMSIKTGDTNIISNINIGKLTEGKHTIAIQINDGKTIPEDNYTNDVCQFNVEVIEMLGLSDEYYISKDRTYMIKPPLQWFTEDKVFTYSDNTSAEASVISKVYDSFQDNCVLCFTEKIDGLELNQTNADSLSSIVQQEMLNANNHVAVVENSSFTVNDIDMFYYVCDVTDSKNPSNNAHYIYLFAVRNNVLYKVVGASTDTKYFDIVKKSVLSFVPI